MRLIIVLLLTIVVSATTGSTNELTNLKEETKEYTVCKGSSIILNAYTIFHELLQKVHDTDEWLEDSQIKWSTAKQLDNPHVIIPTSGYHLNTNQTILQVKDLKPDSPKYFIAQDINLELKAIFKIRVPDCSIYILGNAGKDVVTAYEHDRVVLKVKAAEIGDVTWRLNGKYLDQSNKSNHFKFVQPTSYGYNYGSVLEIHNLKNRHAGIYDIFYDVSGCQCSLKVNLKIEVPPKKKFVNNKFLAALFLFGRKFWPWLKSKKIVFISIGVLMLIAILIIFLVIGLDIRKKIKRWKEKKDQNNGYKTKRSWWILKLWKKCLKPFPTLFKKKVEHGYQKVATNSGN